MRYYPVNLDLHNKLAVVVGGGRVAARKAGRLLDAGARVTVVAPKLCDPLEQLAAEGRICHLARDYQSGDLAGAFLSFAATDLPEVNEAVAAEARERGVLVDRVDAPQRGDFSTPAVLSRGELVIAVSTGGFSPALSRKIVEELSSQFGPEYAEALEVLGSAREKILTAKQAREYNDRIFSELLALDLPAMIKNGSRDQVDQLLLKLLDTDSSQATCGAGKKEPS